MRELNSANAASKRSGSGVSAGCEGAGPAAERQSATASSARAR